MNPFEPLFNSAIPFCVTQFLPRTTIVNKVIKQVYNKLLLSSLDLLYNLWKAILNCKTSIFICVYLYLLTLIILHRFDFPMFVDWVWSDFYRLYRYHIFLLDYFEHHNHYVWGRHKIINVYGFIKKTISKTALPILLIYHI